MHALWSTYLVFYSNRDLSVSRNPFRFTSGVGKHIHDLIPGLSGRRSVARVGDDPVVRDLENYIFQLPRTRNGEAQTSYELFPDHSVHYSGGESTVHYAEIVNRKWLDLIPNAATDVATRVDCAPIIATPLKIIEKNDTVLKPARDYMNAYPRIPMAASHFAHLTENCQNFVQTRKYITIFMTTLERDFPLAYSLVVYKDAELVERILRAIYRPQNYYCLHVDAKADAEFVKEVSAIASCLPNVELASRRVDVRWGTLSVMLPDMVCMRDLLRHRKWRYFINLTGQEFPVRNNWELVRVLKSMRGANDLESTYKK